MAAFAFKLDLVIYIFSSINSLRKLCSQSFISMLIYSTFCSFKQFQHLDIGILFIMGVAVSDALSPFLFCFFGKMATDCYINMSDSLFQSNWYILPIELQKCFIVMIGFGQRPIYYHGFNVMILDLETFTAVSKVSKFLLCFIGIHDYFVFSYLKRCFPII